MYPSLSKDGEETTTKNNGSKFPRITSRSYQNFYPAVPLDPSSNQSHHELTISSFTPNLRNQKSPPPPVNPVSELSSCESSLPQMRALSHSSRNSSMISSSSSARTRSSSLSSFSLVERNPAQESRKGEAETCCPVCGFQMIHTTNLLTSNQENLPFGTCSVCIEAAMNTNKRTLQNFETFLERERRAFLEKERQVEEDRKLATSLSAILLEEERREVQGRRPNSWECEKSTSLYPRFPDLANQDKTTAQIAISPDRTVGATCEAQTQPSALSENWFVVEDQKAMMAAIAASRDQQPVLPPKPKTTKSRPRTDRQPIHENPSLQQKSLQTEENQRITTDRDSCVYIGEYNQFGQPHGSHGELVWDNGDRYVGNFCNGMRSGQGTFFFRDGSEYTGDWKDNQMHGSGTRKYANGDVYIGQYHCGQRSGGPKCKLRFANGDLYVGGWENDRFHGPGRYFFKHGHTLEGNFVHGIKEGKFKRQLPTEELDIIRFEDDKLVGMGVRWNAKRTKTWLLHIEPEMIPKKDRNRDSLSLSPKSKKLHRRVLGGLGKPLRRRDFLRRTKSVQASLPSSMRRDELMHARSRMRDTGLLFSSIVMPPDSPSFSFPIDNVSQVVPQELLTNIKKSVRIPISQAVSIGYDCEMGTGTKVFIGATVPAK